MSTEFANRELEMRDPKQLLMVTSAHLDNYPEHRELLAKYYDPRADRPMDENFLNTVKEFGAIHTPVFVTKVEALGKDVIVAGRQRLKAALALGLPEIPVIFHTDEEKLNASLELSENFARSASSAVESAAAFRKAMRSGLNQEEIARRCGITGAQVTYLLQLGDMPPIVHEWIAKGKLSQSAALTLKKAVGKKAPAQSGLTAIYDQKEVKAHLEGLEDGARLAGGDKIKVQQAKNSKANPADTMTNRDWKAVIASSETPSDYATLIAAVIGDISPAQARQQGLTFIKKAPPKPKPEKKVKEPKVKGEKSKKTAEATAPQASTTADVKALFGG